MKNNSLIIATFCSLSIAPIFNVLANSAVETNVTIMSGHYDVGMTYFNAIDYSRPETFTENPTDYRDVMVKIWYPAELNSQSEELHHKFHTKQFPYRGSVQPDASDFEYARLLSIPGGAYSNAVAVSTEKPFPIVVYSHGYTSTVEENELMMINLASQGYIVASVGHAHQAQFVTGSNGGYAELDRSKRSEDFNFSDLADVGIYQWFEEMFYYSGRDLSAIEEDRVRTLFNYAEGDKKSLAIWVQDMSFALNKLQNVHYGSINNLANTQPQLASLEGKFDLNNVAAVGMSYGGPTAATFCNQDYRCKAAVNLDGQHYDLSSGNPARKPYLMAQQDMPTYPDFNLVFKQQERDTFLVKVAGTRHWDFTDVRIAFPELQNEYTGTIDPTHMSQLNNSMVSNFLNTYIKGQGSYQSLLDSFETESEFEVKSKKGYY